jgi:hypothetical protein
LAINVDNSGDIEPGAQIDVIDENTGVAPAGGIWSDRAGTMALTNPFFADSNGFAQFYAEPGEYRITATGIGGSVVWRYQVLAGTAAIENLAASPLGANAGEIMILGSYGIGRSISISDLTIPPTGWVNTRGFSCKVNTSFQPTGYPSALSNYYFGEFSVILENYWMYTVHGIDGRTYRRYSLNGVLGGWETVIEDGNLETSSTWTPEVKFGGASVGVTYSSQTGTYVKIGDLVYVTGFVTLTSKGSSTGTFTITGLPFTSDNIGLQNIGQPWMQNMSGLTLGIASSLISANSTTVNFYYQASTTGLQSMSDSNLTDSTTIYLAGVYKAV